MENILGQMSIFDFLPQTVPAEDVQESSKHDLSIGDILYQVRLDTVRRMAAENIFTLDDGRKRASFQEAFDDGSHGLHDVVDVTEIGQTFFWEQEDALHKAKENRNRIIKISADELEQATEEVISYCCVSGKYCKVQLADKKFKTITLTRYGIYEKDAYCYPFLHRYPDMDSASEQFYKMVKKIERKENGYAWCRIPANFSYEDVYRCTESKYAGLDYTLHHGKPWVGQEE